MGKTISSKAEFVESAIKNMTCNMAMHRWDNTWAYHSVPSWLKKKLRVMANKKWSKWIIGELASMDIPLFDHYGSIERNGIWLFVTQPYGNCDDDAMDFAKDMHCIVEIIDPGIWHENTRTYIFVPILTPPRTTPT